MIWREVAPDGVADAGETVIARYEYDALNRRTKEFINADTDDDFDSFRHFYYTFGWQLLETRKTTDPEAAPEDLNPEFQFVWSQRYIDAPVLRDENKNADNDCTDPEDQRLFYLNDANMNVTALVNTSGTVLERYAYTPYGKVTVLNADWSPDADNKSDYDNSILYCGYYYDWETGLYHVRYRYLHHLLSWLSRNPAGPIDGNNLQQYVMSLPIIYTDPDGRFFFIPGCQRVHEPEPPEQSIQDPAVSQSELIKIDGGQPRALYPELPCGAARHYVWFKMLVEDSGSFIQHVRAEVFKFEDCNGTNLWVGPTSEEHWEAAEVHIGNIHTGRAGFVSWLFDFVRAKRLEGTDKFEINNNNDCTRGHWRLTGTSKFIPDYEISSAHWAERGRRAPTMPYRTNQPPGWSDVGGLVHIMDVEWDCCASPRTMNINVQPGVSVMISR